MIVDPAAHRLIVGDIHGDWSNLLALLKTVGAIDQSEHRVPGWFLIQLGDLIHGGTPSSDDSQALSEGMRLFDVLLLGNHEIPHAFPRAGFPTFAGQRPLLPGTRHLLYEAVDQDRVQPCVALDGWLVSHAGVHPRFQEVLGWPSATDAAVAINDLFVERITVGRPDPLFDAVGKARGGHGPVGGIFWLDWSDLRSAASQNRIPQIVGHTPRRQVPEFAGDDLGDGTILPLWCVDVGAALSGHVCALLKANADDTWQPVVY